MRRKGRWPGHHVDLYSSNVIVRTVNIAADHLAPVVPSRGDKVKVILGDEDKEQTGQLLSIDSQVRFKEFWGSS